MFHIPVCGLLSHYQLIQYKSYGAVVGAKAIFSLWFTYSNACSCTLSYLSKPLYCIFKCLSIRHGYYYNSAMVAWRCSQSPQNLSILTRWLCGSFCKWLHRVVPSGLVTQTVLRPVLFAHTSGLLFCPCCCRNPLTSAVILPLRCIVGLLLELVCHAAVGMQSCQASLPFNEQTYFW